MDLQLERAVPSGIITMVEAFFSAMGLQKLLDDLVPFDERQCKLTPGQRITALLLCVFGGRRALYRVEEFYDGHHLERLFGPGVKAEDVTDDALGRALDKFMPQTRGACSPHLPLTPYPCTTSPGRPCMPTRPRSACTGITTDSTGRHSCS